MTARNATVRIARPTRDDGRKRGHCRAAGASAFEAGASGGAEIELDSPWTTRGSSDLRSGQARSGRVCGCGTADGRRQHAARLVRSALAPEECVNRLCASVSLAQGGAQPATARRVARGVGSSAGRVSQLLRWSAIRSRRRSERRTSGSCIGSARLRSATASVLAPPVLDLPGELDYIAPNSLAHPWMGFHE